MELIEFLFAVFIVATLPPEEKATEEAIAKTIVEPVVEVQHIDVASCQQESTEENQESHVIDDSPHVKRAGMWIKEAFTF